MGSQPRKQLAFRRLDLPTQTGPPPVTGCSSASARVLLQNSALIIYSEPISPLGWLYLSRLPTVPPACEE